MPSGSSLIPSKTNWVPSGTNLIPSNTSELPSRTKEIPSGASGIGNHRKWPFLAGVIPAGGSVPRRGEEGEGCFMGLHLLRFFRPLAGHC